MEKPLSILHLESLLTTHSTFPQKMSHYVCEIKFAQKASHAQGRGKERVSSRRDRFFISYVRLMKCYQQFTISEYHQLPCTFTRIDGFQWISLCSDNLM